MTQSQQTRAVRVRQQPVVTWSIIGICVLVWLGELGIDGFFSDVAFSSAAGRVEPWRFLTSAFAHATNPTHILFNMYALWALGQGMEYYLGKARFVALYLLSALGGSVAFLWFTMPPSATTGVLGTNWYTGLVGASGAVFGLFGALLLLNKHLGRSSQSLYGVLAINFAIGFLIPGIAWQAHFGGFATGALVGYVMTVGHREKWRGRPDHTGLWMASVFVALVALAVAKYAVVGQL